MALELTTPSDPDALAVSVAEAKLSMKVDYDIEDDLIAQHLRTAQQYAETYQGRRLQSATYRLHLDEFPEVIQLRLQPVRSVESITYVNESGVPTVLDSSAYRVDLISRPSRITPAYGTWWPYVLPVTNCVTVEFVCGYSSPEDIPDSTKTAILLQVGWLYANREPAPYELEAVNSLLNYDCWGRA